MARSHEVALLAAAVAAVWLAQCTFSGLDAYDTGGTHGDASSDVLQESAVGDAGCSCGANLTCVLGKCEACLATWKLDYRPGMSVGGEVLDPTSNVLYVAGSSAFDDAGATSGYLALVDSCTGTLLKAFDAPMFGSQAIPALGDPVLVGGKLFLRTLGLPGVPGGYVRFDMATQAFDGMLSPLTFPTGQAETWQMVAGTGGVWFSGDQSYTSADAAAPVIVRSDGNGTYCATALAVQTGNERSGRAITVSGNDVYQFSTSDSTVLRHFDATKCTLQPCACAPTWTSPEYTITGTFMGAFRTFVIGQKLYFGGAVSLTKDLVNMEGFVSYYDLSANKFWTTPYLYDPTTAEDGFLQMTTDGTHIYAAGGNSMSNLDFATAQGVVVVLDLALNPITTVSTPSVKPFGGVVPVAGGFVISGSSSTNSTVSRTERCTLQQCP